MSESVVPFRTVTNLHLKRSLLDRYVFHLGTLNVETAGLLAALLEEKAKGE